MAIVIFVKLGKFMRYYKNTFEWSDKERGLLFIYFKYPHNFIPLFRISKTLVEKEIDRIC